MRFQNLQALWLLVPGVLALPIWLALERRAMAALSRWISPEMFSRMVRSFSPARRRARAVFIWLAAALAIASLARPQMGTHEETLNSQGLDVVMLLDVSTSMLAEDVVPSRLKKGKHIIRTFLDKMSGDRVGVVAFANSSYVSSPLTTDYEFIKQAIEILDERSISNQGSNLAKGLGVAMELLDRGGMGGDGLRGESDGASGIIIVLSDGEKTSGEETALYKTLGDKGIRVYGIGIGSLKGAPIPIRDQAGVMTGYKRDRSGSMVLTKLETENLEKLSSKTGGKTYNSSANEGEVDEILGELTGAERSEGAGRRVVVYEEFFQVPLAIAVALLLASLLSAESPRRRKTAADSAAKKAAILALLFVCATDVRAAGLREYRDTREGVTAYKEGDYPEAIRRFGNAQADNPDSMQHRLNLGDALLKAGSAEAAIREFNAGADSPDANFAAKNAYNMGRAYEAAENLEMALRSYQKGLDRLASAEKPDDEVAQRLKRALQRTQQQQKQQKQQQKDKQKDGKDDKQQKDPKDQDKKEDEKEQKQFKNPKPKFKAEKLNEEDAKRILKQLQEQEKKTQTRMMQKKTGKAKDEKTEKDW